MSHRESIVAQISTVLSTALPSATVARSRLAPAAREDGIVVALRPESEDVQRLSGAHVRRRLVVVITVVARGAIPDQVADASLAAIVAAMLADQSLGGRCAQVDEMSSAWSYELADLNATAVELRYQITYATPASSLASQA